MQRAYNNMNRNIFSSNPSFQPSAAHLDFQTKRVHFVKDNRHEVYDFTMRGAQPTIPEIMGYLYKLKDLECQFIYLNMVTMDECRRVKDVIDNSENNPIQPVFFEGDFYQECFPTIPRDITQSA